MAEKSAWVRRRFYFSRQDGTGDSLNHKSKLKICKGSEAVHRTVDEGISPLRSDQEKLQSSQAGLKFFNVLVIFYLSLCSKETLLKLFFVEET